MEPRHNKPPNNEVLGITNNFSSPLTLCYIDVPLSVPIDSIDSPAWHCCRVRINTVAVSVVCVLQFQVPEKYNCLKQNDSKKKFISILPQSLHESSLRINYHSCAFYRQNLAFP